MRLKLCTGILGLAFAVATHAGETAKAVATLQPTKGNTVTGTVSFTKVQGGVKVVADLTGLTPGEHGFHIHEKGDCSDPEAKSAGGHFNPGGMPHAGPKETKRHAGDFGNIEIKADGTGDLDMTSDMLTVKPGPNSVVGRAVVFHEKADDLKTQPTGNAGGRFGCGVIQ